MWRTPRRTADDGRLEVVTITAPSKPYLADRVRGVLLLEDEAAERRFLVDVSDGEALGSLPLGVEVVPKRLCVRA